MKSAGAALATAVCLTANAAAFDVRYWAWQRNGSPDDAQSQQLATQNVRVLYWQVAEFEQTSAGWSWKARFDLPALKNNIDVIPVVRLESRQRHPFAADSISQLVPMLAGLADHRGELQLDYDCPDALIADYATMLQQLRTRVPHVTITALPHWSHSEATGYFRECVDELLPMLYDFEPDPERQGAAPIPLLLPEKVASYLHEWNRIQIPWRAGLPVFARATVFDANGKSRGHIRQWSWDDISFNSALKVVDATRQGVTKFRAEQDSRIGNAAIRPDQLLVTRTVDRDALARAVTEARETNARGVVFFRLPDSTDPSGWSLPQIANLSVGPHFVLQIDAATSELELLNDSDADLAPEFDAKSGRGYALQIDAPAALFRDANQGDFWRVVAHVHPDDRERHAVPVQLATRLTFWFSALRAHQTLRTGAIRLASGADFSQIRYRILNFTPQSNWQSVLR